MPLFGWSLSYIFYINVQITIQEFAHDALFNYFEVLVQEKRTFMKSPPWSCVVGYLVFWCWLSDSMVLDPVDPVDESNHWNGSWLGSRWRFWRTRGYWQSLQDGKEVSLAKQIILEEKLDCQ